MAPPLPDISAMKLSELKSELSLYGVDSSGFCEKSEFTSALQHARDTLPRPSTSYREVEAPVEDKKKSSSSAAARSKAKPSSSSASALRHCSSGGSNHAAPPPAPTTATTPPPASAAGGNDMKKLLASRSPVTALQQIREHPSERVVGERSSSFLPGAPFSFSLKGSTFEADCAIIRVPEGVCWILNSASVERKSMETFLMQKGSIGVSLKISTEENPTLLPVWTFDRERSKSYTVSDLGIRVAGPRTVRLMAFMEMGFRSGATVDLNVFGNVRLDTDKF
ncbi:hypothetical protein HJC23_012283 [Cyclotella cryptica]|uniref:Calmodulin n=1 Tax=Cyclotella cryptica TaxID=29204 RepID=A0ABD3NF32_9STRA|eukprot:CCRYP_021111-RA/>CCRYP_021111-RA protein AED:0.17 eAED:0.17 QI:0/-1/0/1/-1/1/1/0/279